MLSYTVAGNPRVITVPSAELEHELEGLCSVSEYTVSAMVVYVDGAMSESVTVTFTTLEGDSLCGM